MDLYGRPRLSELLEALDQVEGLDWIRLMYFYPMYVDERLARTIAGASKILPYIDMPLQHINDGMLRRMARRVDRRQTEATLDLLRETIPDLVLRTTFITGFPGETEAAVDELVAFVERHKFERLGVFTYSFEPDTPAAKLPDQIDEATKDARRDRLMAAQQDVAFDWNEAQIGRRFPVMIDQAVPENPGAWIGRSWADAPDIDGLVFVTETDFPLQPGDLVECEIVTAKDYDLVGAAVGEPSRRAVPRLPGSGSLAVL
jgi:ribosomal protein S12 methylthiotransferase